MEKENVLEIEITKINNEWSAMTITKLDKTLENNDMVGWRGDKDTDFNFYERKIYINPFHPHQPFLILSRNIGLAETIINEINKKYGIPKRWRAEEAGDNYFYISGTGEIRIDEEGGGGEDYLRYELGNYFKTDEEARKIINSKEWKDFWAKVRAGEIGGEK
nr:MAG TPA: hypothetical protein [Caudoviricetes sp.]